MGYRHPEPVSIEYRRLRGCAPDGGYVATIKPRCCSFGEYRTVLRAAICGTRAELCASTRTGVRRVGGVGTPANSQERGVSVC